MVSPKEGARQRRRNRLFVELLESRQVSSAITWSVANAPTGGDWNVPNNWVGGHVPGAGDTAKITGLTSPGTVFLMSGGPNSVQSLTTDSSTTLEVITGSLSFAVGSSSTLGGEVDVSLGASLSVAAGASVTIGAGQKLVDVGALTFGSGDTVSFPTSNGVTTQIVVDGTLTASSTTFANPGNASGSTNQIYVGSDGELIASNSTFGINDVYLTSGSVVNSGDLTNDTFNTTLTA